MQPRSAATIEKPAILLMVPPPLMFAAAFGVGALLQRLVPLPAAAGVAAERWVGAAILAAGLGFGLSLAVRFLMRRTTLNPFAVPADMLVTGPYGLSRNPMYLTLIVAYLGGTLMLGSLWPLVTLAGPVAILARVVIPFEEARMLAVFGGRYRDHCARVRRWL